MAKSDRPTDPFDSSSVTGQLRAVSQRMKEEQIREEYELRDRERDRKALYALREKFLQMEKRVDKLEWWSNAVKWAGGPAVLALISMIVERLMH